MSHISFVLLPLHYRYWMHAARSQNTFLIIFHINEKNGWTLYMLVAVNILLNLSWCHIPCKTICPEIKLYLTITRNLQNQKKYAIDLYFTFCTKDQYNNIYVVFSTIFSNFNDMDRLSYKRMLHFLAMLSKRVLQTN